MEYTVNKLALLAGITTRTLRYYDEIGLLKPTRISSSGYRIYGPAEVDRLQQILFYRELGVSLDRIGDILQAPSFDRLAALREHRLSLLDKRRQLDLLIANVEKTIADTEGRIIMTDAEKFAGFKQKLLQENEQKYGREIRNQYGDQAVNRSYERLQELTRQQYEQWESLGNEVIATLLEAMAGGDPAGELAQKTADLHRQWLSYTWDSYSREAHAGLARMYVEDERFSGYYDRHQPGAAVFLRDAILIYTGKKGQLDEQGWRKAPD